MTASDVQAQLGISGIVDEEVDRLRRRASQEFRASSTTELHARPVGSAGKLLRPRILFLCALHGLETSGTVDWSIARTAALAVEMAHVGTLYHDDIVDRSDVRRGQAAVHRRWGVRVASLGGAHLLTHANSLVARLPEPLPGWWARAALDVSAGQLQEMESAGDLSISVDAYIATVRRKTGALFEFAAKCGAYAGGIDDLNAFAALGSSLGTAYQLCDDSRDFELAQPAARARATDVRNRFYSLPIQLAVRSTAPEASELRLMLENDGRPLCEDNANRVLELVLAADGFGQAAKVAAAQREPVMTALRRLPPSAAASQLADMVTSFFESTPGDLLARSQ